MPEAVVAIVDATARYLRPHNRGGHTADALADLVLDYLDLSLVECLLVTDKAAAVDRIQDAFEHFTVFWGQPDVCQLGGHGESE